MIRDDPSHRLLSLAECHLVSEGRISYLISRISYLVSHISYLVSRIYSQVIMLADIAQKPSGSRRYHEIFRVPLPEALEVQTMILFDILEVSHTTYSHHIVSYSYHTVRIVSYHIVSRVSSTEGCSITLQYHHFNIHYPRV